MSGGTRDKGFRSAPTSLVSVRLTAAEKAALKDMAGSKGLSTYLRDKALDGMVGQARRVHRPKPGPNTRILSELLACLGRTGLAGNIRRLADAAERGALQFDPDASRDLKSAFNDIAAMRTMLVDGLGLREPEPRTRPKDSLSMTFTRAAAPYTLADGEDDEDWLR